MLANIFVRVSSHRYMLACVPIKDSDQTEHPLSLIRAFDGHSMGSHATHVSSGVKLRLTESSDVQTDLNLCCTHMPTFARYQL